MFKNRESKWQKKWRDSRSFVPLNDNSKPKYYNLIEFPFPSGAGLHVGHMLPYTGMDVLARYRRMCGLDVLYPIGYDSMGIAAEHYAVKVGKHPRDSVAELIKKFESDIAVMGLSFNPESVVATSDPEFIKWTQWMFIQFFNAGLAYKSELPMNWCPNCKTGLTNEELEDGCCERCHGPVEKKMKMQWNLAMSKYADRLIEDLSLVDYAEHIKKQQINWIGRSYGADVDFRVSGDEIMTVYTTRIDTIFGVTFAVLAPEHDLVQKWLDKGLVENAGQVRDYIKASAAKSEFERTDGKRDKTGIKLQGISGVNPFNGKEIPLFISDYVLADYGFGAVMAVPAHDQRDFDFAKKFDLPIIPVLDNGFDGEKATEGDGLHINSEYLDGLNKEQAIKTALVHGGAFARGATQYRLKDWGFSRQMYWGEPIPMVHCDCCGWVPVPDDQLPILQPHIESFRPTEEGESPLARATDWVNTTCPKCGGAARRETDTMPGWAGSSWYYLRYLDPRNDNQFCNRPEMEKWMPVDHYNGGNEHNTRHLLYSRFWYKALYDLGLVPGPEPYKKRTTSGLMMAADGRKMSKSLNNYVPSAEVVARSGADVCRMTILFLGPWEQNVNWSEDTLRGVERFLKRVENMMVSETSPNAEQERLENQLVKDVSERIESMQFNTAISAMMTYINEFSGDMPRDNYETLLKCLNPFAPHLCEEMWEKLGHKEMLVFEAFPKSDETKLGKTTQTISVSVNGKFRGAITLPSVASREEIEAKAKEQAEKYITEIVKTIYVPGRMVNFVVK